MRADRRGSAWALAAALLACSASAWGAEPGPDALPINVIAVQTPDADDQAEALTKALRNAVRATPGWSLGEGDYSLEVLTLSLKCPEPPDANCQSRIADQIKADRYIWGVIKKKGANIQGDLYLWVRGQGTSKVPLAYAANLTEANDESLRRIATNAVTQLTGGPPKGSLHVKAGNVPGQIFLDGQPVGALQGGEATLVVPSGSHRITVKAPGYTDGEAEAVVRPVGAPAEVAVTLMPIEVKTPTNWKMIGGYTALGLGVGFGAVGLFGSLKVNSLNNSEANKDGSLMKQYRESKRKDVDVCDAAAEEKDTAASPVKEQAAATYNICQRSRVPFALQLVFYPLAAISAGTGIYLLGTSLSSPKPTATGFRILPEAGPEGAKLNVRYTW